MFKRSDKADIPFTDKVQNNYGRSRKTTKIYFGKKCLYQENFRKVILMLYKTKKTYNFYAFYPASNLSIHST